MDSYSPNKRIRDARKNGEVVNEFMTLPKVGEPHQARIQVARDMPGVIILVHGVNDVGEAYATQARGLCEGLNLRLGRNDLSPGTWDIPRACGENRRVSYERRAEAQGRNAIIPFYWGYRPVDKATYEADQARYREELRRRGKEGADAPYDAYYVHGKDNPRTGYQNTDCFGNWLNDYFAKNGGVFANATTNLVDMWGPGSDILGFARWYSKNLDDLSHPIYDNPHRIYLVWAAQRLANLIAEIRNNPPTKDDSITLVAHSQGTLLSLLANNLVAHGGRPSRPADCLILNHSPYSFVATGLEAYQAYGPQQSERARIETFVNACKLIDAQKLRGPDANTLIARGIASSAVRDKPHHLRDNHGKIFNYFCPHDMTVSLDNVEGFGWQGVPEEVSNRCGPAFGQRMFLDGQAMHQQHDVRFALPDLERPWSKVPTNEDVPTGAIRHLSADPLPDLGYTFTLADGCGTLTPSTWGVRAAASVKFPAVRMRTENLDHPPQELKLPLKPTQQTRRFKAQEITSLQDALRRQGKDWIILRAWYDRVADRTTVVRYATEQDLLDQARQTETEDSRHSAIVTDQSASKCVTAFDVAIGRCKSYDTTKVDGGEFWQKLLRLADWRDSSQRADVDYYTKGLLPKEIKDQMNKPSALPGVVNETADVSAYGRSVSIWDKEIEQLKARRDSMTESQYQQRLRQLELDRRYFRRRHQQATETNRFSVVDRE